MEQIDSQIMETPKDTAPKMKKSKIWIVIISIILVVVLVASGVYAYINYYKIPHDAAIVSYNNAVGQYNVAVSALEERNKALDEGISALGNVIYADNIPLDDSLMTEANTVIEDARSIEKDTAATLPGMPQKTDEINAEAARILGLIPEVDAMGDYSETLELLSATEEKYRAMIEQFQGCKVEVLWMGVDEDSTVLRFVVKLTNENDYPMRDVATEWVAYDKNDAIVGSFDGSQPDIPANSCIYYVGGAGGANLAANPARIEMNITTEGILTDRVMPQITVSNVQLINGGWGTYDVTADCVTDAEIMTANLDGQVIVKDADGNIIDAEFWRADNLPDSIPADGKFVMSEFFYGLPAVPATAEVYMYYVWQ